MPEFFGKFLRTPFLTEHLWWLLLTIDVWVACGLNKCYEMIYKNLEFTKISLKSHCFLLIRLNKTVSCGKFWDVVRNCLQTQDLVKSFSMTVKFIMLSIFSIEFRFASLMWLVAHVKTLKLVLWSYNTLCSPKFVVTYQRICNVINWPNKFY